MIMGDAAEKRDVQQFFATPDAASYLGISKAALVKLVQRGRINPDRPACAGGLRVHLFSRQTLERFGRGK
jgi:hypothetical protein